jgi:hypothetical protein
MKPFNAAMFFGMSRIIFSRTQAYGLTHELTAKEKAETLKAIVPLKEQGQMHDLSGLLAAFSSIDRLFAAGTVAGGDAKHQLELLANGIRFDLEREKFFHMSLSDSKRYNLSEPFGSDVVKNFPSATFDSREAGNCFAVSCYTACVYHSMRVLEYGLKAFLNEFPTLNPSNPNWGVILNEIEKEVIALPKANPKKERYLGLITDFRIFKDAWRNDVAHAGTKYLEDDGDSIYRHVGRFMKGLAANGYHE